MLYTSDCIIAALVSLPKIVWNPIDIHYSSDYFFANFGEMFVYNHITEGGREGCCMTGSPRQVLLKKTEEMEGEGVHRCPLSNFFENFLYF